MVPLAEAMKALPASQRPPFSNGRVQIDLEHMRSLQRIGDSDYAVMLGPLDEALPDEGWQDSEVSGVAILLLILMVAVALPMYVMVYRLWRDVSQLAQAARQMRDGQLDTRAPRAGTALVRPLANAFNHMAEQLQQLLEASACWPRQWRTKSARRWHGCVSAWPTWRTPRWTRSSVMPWAACALMSIGCSTSPMPASSTPRSAAAIS